LRRSFSSLGLGLGDWALITLLLFLAAAVAVFAVHAVKAVLHRYPLDYGEAPLVDQAMRLASGQNIYRSDISSPPYTISNYPPLYVVSMVPSVKLFGPNFWAGRAISVLSALASAILIALIIYSQTADWLASAAAGMFFLAFPFVVHWACHARIDSLALAFSLAGLYLLARWPTMPWSTVASALLLVAAIYTRQSHALAAPLAAFVWLCTHDWRRAFRLAALVGGLTLILFFILNALTRGGFFFNVVTANVNEFVIEQLKWFLRQFRDTAFILLILSGSFLLLAAGKAPAWPLLAPYLVGAALSSLTIAKIGAYVNYFFEISAALSLTAGALIAWSRKNSMLRVVLPLLLTMQTLQLMVSTFDEYFGDLNYRIESVGEIRELEKIVADAEGPILGDEYMGLVTLQGRPLYIQPFEVTQLANARVWDQTPVLEGILNREFPVILIHYFPHYPVYRERWTPEMLSAINQTYAPAESLAHTRVYCPK
jgi:4-amino-4-deoxy-L-arabinose transferase-like glycosyltransferase